MIDSGATRSITNNKELLDEVSECQYSIKLADNNKL